MHLIWGSVETYITLLHAQQAFLSAPLRLHTTPLILWATSEKKDCTDSEIICELWW